MVAASPTDLDSLHSDPLHVAKKVATTLLVAPPSLASHPEHLEAVFRQYERASSDLQMLDRIGVGLVKLPESAYDAVVLLADFNDPLSVGDRGRGTSSAISRQVMAQLAAALRPGGVFRTQEKHQLDKSSAMRNEAILAGLVDADGEMMKMNIDEQAGGVISLRTTKQDSGGKPFGVENGKSASDFTAKSTASSTTPYPSPSPATTSAPLPPAGVGFVDDSMDDGADSDGLDVEDDDELIDEDTLLSEADLARPAVLPPECQPAPGKRRRACKDCTCGLKQRLDAEDRTKRARADATLALLPADDLVEVDFTVKGKVGSCGNCSLGDAFRCDGCPYVGLPPFKPGEEVRLLNNDVQL